MRPKPEFRKPSKSPITDDKEIVWSNVELLKKFVSDRGKIFPAARSGLTAKQQRLLTRAIKNARFMAMMSYTEK